MREKRSEVGGSPRNYNSQLKMAKNYKKMREKRSEVGRGARNDINWDDEPHGNQLWSPSDNQH